MLRNVIVLPLTLLLVACACRHHGPHDHADLHQRRSHVDGTRQRGYVSDRVAIDQFGCSSYAFHTQFGEAFDAVVRFDFFDYVVYAVHDKREVDVAVGRLDV